MALLLGLLLTAALATMSTSPATNASPVAAQPLPPTAPPPPPPPPAGDAPVPNATGVTMRTIDATRDSGMFSSLKLNAREHPVVSHQADGALHLAVCHDPTCLHATSKEVDWGGSAGAFSSLQLTAEDHPVVGYIDSFRPKVAVCSDPECTNSTRTFLATTTPGESGLGSALQLRNGTLPVVAYEDSGLGLTSCTTADCAPNTTQTAKLFGNISSFMTLVLNEQGHPRISFVRWWTSDLVLAACSDPVCAQGATLAVISAASRGVDRSLVSALALNAQGHPLVLFHCCASRLRLALCSDPTCAATPQYQDIAPLYTSRALSMALTRAGHPVAAYYASGGDNELRVAVCSDPRCAAAPTIRSVYRGRYRSGAWVSVALTAADLPVLAFSGENGTLALASCSTPTCSVAPGLGAV